jgi:hypothetical protein
LIPKPDKARDLWESNPTIDSQTRQSERTFGIKPQACFPNPTKRENFGNQPTSLIPKLNKARELWESTPKLNRKEVTINIQTQNTVLETPRPSYNLLKECRYPKGDGIMNLEMQKAIMLSENIHGFIKFVQKQYDERNSHRFHPDKLLQIKFFVEEYRFKILADELWRINQYEWDKKYTHYLVDEFIKGIRVIDEYIKRNPGDLFLLEARLYTLKSLSHSIKQEDLWENT